MDSNALFTILWLAIMGFQGTAIAICFGRNSAPKWLKIVSWIAGIFLLLAVIGLSSER